MKEDKAKKIERSIRLVWDSLESHLECTHTLTSGQKKFKEDVGDCKFHKKCIKDYAFIIQTLSELY